MFVSPQPTHMHSLLKILPGGGDGHAAIWQQGFPENYNYRIGFARCRYLNTPEFEMVSQVVRGSDYRIELLTIGANKSENVQLMVGRPVICFAFLLSGNIGDVMLGKEKVRLGAGTYNLYYLPRGSYPIRLLKDQYVLISLIPPRSLLQEMSKEHQLVRRLVEKQISASLNAEMLESFHFPTHLWRAIKQIENKGLSGVSLDLTIRQYITKLLALYHLQLGSVSRINTGLSSTQKAYLVRDYIIEHFREPGLGKLPELASQFHITPKSLTREFQRLFNRTVPAFVKDERLEWAYLLLLHDDKSISDVAALVGYTDPANFTREFKKRFKLSPGQLRVKGRD